MKNRSIVLILVAIVLVAAPAMACVANGDGTYSGYDCPEKDHPEPPKAPKKPKTPPTPKK